MKTVPIPTASQLRANSIASLRLDGPRQRAVEVVFDQALAFFRRPLLKKNLDAAGDSGFRPQGTEYSRLAERPDRADSFTVSLPLQCDRRYIQSSEGKALFDAMTRALRHLLRVGEIAVAGIAEECGLRTKRTWRGALDTWSILQLNYTRPDTHAVGELIHDEHQDGHLLTLHRSNAPGFEIKATGGNWRSAGSDDDALLFGGEALWLMTGALFRPLIHRVKALNDHERLALLLFFDLEPDQCIPWRINATNENVDIPDFVARIPERYGLRDVVRETWLTQRYTRSDGRV
jgi:isopenicillin N synthase-like dioxygenase